MAPVALDADVLIAFFDPGDAQHERAVEEIRAKIAAGEQLLVGASVYAEVMVRPLERGSGEKVDEFLLPKSWWSTSTERWRAVQRSCGPRLDVARRRSIQNGHVTVLAE